MEGSGWKGRKEHCRGLPRPPASAKWGLSNSPAQLQPVGLGSAAAGDVPPLPLSSRNPGDTAGAGPAPGSLRKMFAQGNWTIRRLGKVPPVLHLEEVFCKPESSMPLPPLLLLHALVPGAPGPGLHPLPRGSSSARIQVALNSCLFLQQNKIHSQIIPKSPGAASGVRRVL